MSEPNGNEAQSAARTWPAYFRLASEEVCDFSLVGAIMKDFRRNPARQ